MKSSTDNKIDLIIIPMFNESGKIFDVIQGLKKTGHNNILVVSDGSTDNGAEIARNTGACVVSHSINRGAGAAVMTGVCAAKMLKADRIVTFDADGQHNPDDIEKLLNQLDNDNVDVVLGYRDFSEKTMPFMSKVANYVGNIVTLLIFNIHVKDSQSGLRAYSNHAMQLIDFDFQGYEYCSALVGELRNKNIKYSEIPIDTHYSHYSTTKKAKQNFSNGLKTLMRLLST